MTQVVTPWFPENGAPAWSSIALPTVERLVIRIRERNKREPVVWVDLVKSSRPIFSKELILVTLTIKNRTKMITPSCKVGFNHTVFGQGFDSPYLRKTRTRLRTAKFFRVPHCDVSLSLRNVMCILVSPTKCALQIHTTDNAVTAYVDDLYVERLPDRTEVSTIYSVVLAAAGIKVADSPPLDNEISL